MYSMYLIPEPDIYIYRLHFVTQIKNTHDFSKYL